MYSFIAALQSSTTTAASGKLPATEEEEIQFWDIKPEKKQRISLRIEPSLIEDLKRLAKKHDTRYQTLARGLIKRGIRELDEAG